ncbi:lamin tail domain-containing protein [bacterium]|nr:lamin tail domain-containing protein [bacterium]
MKTGQDLSNPSAIKGGILGIVLLSILLLLVSAGSSTSFLANGFQVYFTDPQQYCGNPNALDNKFMDFIRSAQDSVNAAFFELRWMNYSCFPNPTGTFCAISESVQVQIISDNQFFSTNPDYDSLSHYGVNTAHDAMGICPQDKDYSMHNKFCIVDGQKVWTGSTNNTYSGCWWNNNASMVIDCADLAQAYEEEFHEMWGTMRPNHQDARFHTCKYGNTPSADTANCNGIEVEHYFSPPSCTEDRIVAAMDNARENIYFCVYVITSDDIGDALIDAHSRGIWVECVVDSFCLQCTGSEYNRLVANGVPVCYVAHDWGYMHHKFMVVDHNTTQDPKVLLGSNNWSYSADNWNDENMIVVHDQNVAAVYYNEFRKMRNICASLSGGETGTLTLDDNIYIGLDTTAVITVTDNDSLVNRDPGAADTTVVTVQSQGTDTVGELIPLVETGPNTGQFTGIVGFESSAVKGNGKVAVVNEEKVTVTYNDAVTALGLGVLVTDEALWYASPDSFPQIYINELYVDPPSAGEGAEFVELYNPRPKAIDLSGWRLQDEPYYAANIWEFPEGTSISSNNFLIIAKDGSDPTNDGFLEEFGFHADFEYYDVPNEPDAGKVDDSLAVNLIQITFTTSDNQIKLSNSSDGVFLFIGNTYTTGIVVDSLTYSSSPGTGKSWGRCPDGGDSVQALDTPTPRSCNCLLPIADLTAALSDSSIVLIWSPAQGGSGADHYVVYRDTIPGFEPGPDDSLAETSDTIYTDNTPGITGDTGVNYFYAVKAVDAGGYKSAASNIAGEFDRSLISISK